jgi:hypothetical protein
MSKKVYSTSIGTKWQSDIKYDSNRRKHNTNKKAKKGKK